MAKEDTVRRRQERQKTMLFEQLRRLPIREVAYEKIGISRMTVSRWRKASKKFADEMDAAISEGRAFMVEVAESQLFALIGEKEFHAIRLYLTTHSDRYANKLALSGTITTKDEPLTREQKALIRQALRLSSLRNYAKKDK